jgi:hypothetical protein
MIESRHSRPRVPIGRSQSEFACGLRTGVLMTLSPMRATEASSRVEKIASRSCRIKRYVWSEGIASRSYCSVQAALGWAVTLR